MRGATVFLVLTACSTSAAVARPGPALTLPPFSILSPIQTALSPYRRPQALQLRRVLAEAYAQYGERKMALEGLPAFGRLGADIQIQEAGRRGRGLFALRDFVPDEIVCRYSGTVASIAEYQEAWHAGLTSGDYIARANDDGSVVVDSDVADGNGPGRYVNHSKLWANCVISSFTLDVAGETVPTGTIYIATTKAVKAGSEFFVDYGDEYWRPVYEQSNGALEELKLRVSVDYWP